MAVRVLPAATFASMMLRQQRVRESTVLGRYRRAWHAPFAHNSEICYAHGRGVVGEEHLQDQWAAGEPAVRLQR